jgi:hypothetical protein
LLVPILEVAAAVTACLAPYTPYLIEAGKKFAGEAGKKFAGEAGGSAWKKAEQIWTKLVSGGDANEVKAAAKALSKDINDADFGELLAAAIRRHLELRPKLADELTSMLGGVSAVQEILAEDNAFVSGVKQRMLGPGRQTAKASGSAQIENVEQHISHAAKPKRK